MRVEAGGGQRADADPVGLILIVACEVDLLLRGRTLRDCHGPLQRVATAAGGAEDHGAEHQRGRQDALPAVGMHGPRNVTLGDVGDLVCDDAGQLVLVSSGLDQARVHADVAAGQGEGVDVGVVHDEECERVVSVISLRGDAVADIVDVLGDLRIFDDCTAEANIAHDLPANLRLDRLGKHRVGGATHVRQLDIVRACA